MTFADVRRAAGGASSAMPRGSGNTLHCARTGALFAHAFIDVYLMRY